MKKILYIVLILVLTSTNLLASSAESKIVFWGFDALFYSEWKDGKVSLRPISEHVIKNIISVSMNGNSLCILGMEANLKGEALKPFLLDLKTQQIKKLPIQIQPLFNLELAPEGRRLAFLSYQTSERSAGDFKIGIYDIVKESFVILNGVKVSRDTVFTWHPNGQELVYASKDGMINFVNITDAKITSMFRGGAPAWSPEGSRLAYRSGNEIRIYDSANKSTATVYNRNSSQSPMLGRLYWSPDGRYISFNVAAGIDGNELSYIVLDVTSKKFFTSYEGTYWGGPWLSAK